MSESADINTTGSEAAGEAASDEIRDPICGKVVDPLRARAVGIYSGTTVYFCSPECKAGYVDPRSTPAEAAPPDGVERRWKDEGTGEWFVKGAAAPVAADKVERFSDLDAQGAQPKVMPAPSPSLLIELAGAKKKPAWRWVILVLALGGAALWFFGIRG